MSISSGEINLSLAPALPSDAIKIKRKVCSEGKKCRTCYQVISVQSNHSLLEITLHSGRKHQIRAHLSAIGHPIVGDAMYRRQGLPFLWQYYCRRISPWTEIPQCHALHAHYLELEHPVFHHRMGFSASVPHYWQKFYDTL